MVLVTLIGECHARIGNRFYYMGPTEECKECKMKNICFNLEHGALYEVVQLRDTRHECSLRGDKVRVVVVEKVPFQAAIPKKLAIDGSMITFEKRGCDNLACENRRYCAPVNAKDGGKYSITKIIGDLKCPMDEKLVLVKIE